MLIEKEVKMEFDELDLPKPTDPAPVEPEMPKEPYLGGVAGESMDARFNRIERGWKAYHDSFRTTQRGPLGRPERAHKRAHGETECKWCDGTIEAYDGVGAPRLFCCYECRMMAQSVTIARRNLERRVEMQAASKAVKEGRK